MSVLDGVEWEAVPTPDFTDGPLPYVTHTGVLELMGHTLRCFRLSTGEAVFEAEDFKWFAEALLGGSAPEARAGTTAPAGSDLTPAVQTDAADGTPETSLCRPGALP